MSPKVMLFLWFTLVLISPSSVSFPGPSSNSVSFRTPHPQPSPSVSAGPFPVGRPQCCNWLVQTWPAGYCYKRRVCKRDFEQWWFPNFTIHGLWPVDSNGNVLDVPFHHCMDRDDICEVIQRQPQTRLLSADMATYWPSLKFQYNVDLWRKEWNKHGRYQNSLEPAAYFINTIQLVRDINLTDILEEEGIVPSNSHRYLIESYIRAIKKYTQARPLLLCNRTKYFDGNPVLSEVVICVDETTNDFVSCTVPRGYQRLCPPQGQIWFLDSSPLEVIFLI